MTRATVKLVAIAAIKVVQRLSYAVLARAVQLQLTVQRFM